MRMHAYRCVLRCQSCHRSSLQYLSDLYKKPDVRAYCVFSSLNVVSLVCTCSPCNFSGMGILFVVSGRKDLWVHPFCSKSLISLTRPIINLVGISAHDMRHKTSSAAAKIEEALRSIINITSFKTNLVSSIKRRNICIVSRIKLLVFVCAARSGSKSNETPPWFELVDILLFRPTRTWNTVSIKQTPSRTNFWLNLWPFGWVTFVDCLLRIIREVLL